MNAIVLKIQRGNHSFSNKVPPEAKIKVQCCPTNTLLATTKVQSVSKIH